MPKVTLELTPIEAEHIYQLLIDCKSEGCYYGQKAHYYKRTDTLLEKFKQIIEAE